MELNHTIKSDTLDSQSTVEYTINNKIKTYKKLHTVMVLLLLFWFFLLMLYFMLPPFQCKNIKASGNTCFTDSDLANLSENVGYKPLLFLDKDTSCKKILDNSHGLIKSCEYENNGFVATVKVNENYPLGKFKNGETSISYFIFDSSDETKTLDDVLDICISLPLDQDRIYSIKDTLTEQAKSVPYIHFPSGVDITTDNSVYLSLYPLSSLDYNAISNIAHVQYKNKSGNSIWNNVADVICSYKGKNFLLKDCLSDIKTFPLYFSQKNFPDTLLNGLYNDAVDNNRKAATYIFEDDKTSLEVYSYASKISDKVTFYYSEE